MAYKIATGGETSIAWTAGTGATGHGVCFWELSGAAASITLDGSVAHTDNISAITSDLVMTTTVAGSVILIGNGGNLASGTVKPWTGTNVATNIGTTTARVFGGSFITTSTVSSTFTANWTTSRVQSMLGIALQPPSASITASNDVSMWGHGVNQPWLARPLITDY